MNNYENYIKVVLDKDANIVKFESTLDDVEIDSKSVIGKNWFETFIDYSDLEKVMNVFNNLLNNQVEEWKTYKNDIKLPDGTHRFIDFTNEVIVVNDEKFISSFGIEHMYKKQSCS